MAPGSGRIGPISNYEPPKGSAAWSAAGTAARLDAHQVFEGAGANTEDPKRILRVVDETISKLHTVTYDAVHQGEGAYATRSTVVTGRVRLAKLGLGNPLVAKLAAKGTFYPTGSAQGVEFDTRFDGKTIYKLRAKDKTLVKKALSEGDPTERSLGFVTSFFGGGAYDLILFALVNEGLFARLAESPVTSYEGRTAVGGVLCHVIYVEHDAKPGDRRFKEWFYFAVRDNIPRKVETVETDDKGRWGAYVLILSSLRTNVPLADSAFQIAPPSGFQVRSPEPSERPKLLSVGERAPEWELMGPSGDRHSLSEFRGKVVIMDFWATWCSPCVRSLPSLEKLFEKYGHRGVEIFGVNCWEESNSEAYMKEKGYKFPLLLKGETIARAYHVRDIPVVYIIGVDGKIIYSNEGDQRDLSTVVEPYLSAHHM
jgi:thiol-disulfide isomerase/thioredoxin